ncbi:molybdopterin-dependent oxidoreductase [Glaciibacter psychrotolerans]|uniref:DMSO/TMAO reductase YedYZ molybdopterin-dependent catalytic subunit n=1 Tax=Glaciibacter psychrotolerans TaxID=670054 RepID=A0A7Z0EFI6_9MICO|nr:molybdopterin-dependent oxidoreductase [Leifsonia psychrotolerans]NYJ20580.1 DMSO/TMAO reductase YedYZ molybdopterin-dependent catalytic subunit [Leifsonia psychrotolerans]
MSRARQRAWAALAGLASAVVTLGIAEVVALIVAPAASPLLAVGSLVIDLVPGWTKDLVIALFGTNDKLVLIICLGVLVAVLAGVLGLLEYRRPPWGIVGLVLIGGIATLAVTTRAQATGIWALPTVLGMIGGVLVLRLGTIRLRAWAGIEQAAPAPGVAVSRRRFLVFVGGTGIAALIIGIGARALNAGTVAVTTVRDAIRLPKPAVAAPPIPVGAELDIPGITPLVTPNDVFYRIDTALQVPSVDSSTWRLKVTGMVENEVEISFEELLALPLIESTVTLMCVSNDVGGDLAGNAVWLGYPIRELLARAKPHADADMVLSTSVDGFTAGTPLAVLLEPDRDSLLAVGMNGTPLPLEHGFPVRMVVPGLYGYVSATKWLVEMRVTRFADASAYWTDRGWSPKGPIKTESRIDVPSDGSQVAAGRVAIAGVAWAQHTGIDRVEVRVDNGAWEKARLATAISVDTWVQWVYEWEATSGGHTIQVRATDATGATQRDVNIPTVPNGAEGWHTVHVSVA